MHTTRPFEGTDADYEALVALEWAVWPEYHDTIEEWKHLWERNPCERILS